MPSIRRGLAALVTVVALTGLAACGTDESTSSTSTSSTTSQSGTTSSTDAGGDQRGGQGGGPGGVDVTSVTTEDELVAVIQEAYGEASLGLHRGHQPIEAVLDDVLQISHDELHVRMEEQGQNLAAVAEDLGIDPQTLVDALVESYEPAVQGALDSGAITQEQAEAYTAALEEAFTWRIDWDGQEATPSFTGVQV